MLQLQQTRRYSVLAAAPPVQIAMGGATGVGVRATASTTARATHPLLSELRATESVPPRLAEAAARYTWYTWQSA